MAPLKICCRAGCGQKTSTRFCEEHAKAYEKDIQKYKDHNRASSSERGYGSKWRFIRAAFLKQNPVCNTYRNNMRCTSIATEVDHIQSLKTGGTHRFENLQPFCKSCHALKTTCEDNRWGNKNRFFHVFAPLK